MFGYIRIFKPHLRICEYENYKAVYCGLCKELGKSYGLAMRFTLSYDFAFLAMLSLSYDQSQVKIEKQRCIAHPFKKTQCAVCNGNFKYPSAAAVLTVYHKLLDDKHDKGAKAKLRAMFMLPLLKRSYKKASSQYPELSDEIEKAMALQRQIEKEKSHLIDEACEPTAQIMKAIFSEISQNQTEKRVLERFGYFFGRYIYMCDAADDLEDDFKKNNYNALLLQKTTEEFTDSDREYYINIARESVNLTLAELSNAFVLLCIEKYDKILENIIYLGLKNTFEQIIRKEITE